MNNIAIDVSGVMNKVETGKAYPRKIAQCGLDDSFELRNYALKNTIRY